MKPVHDSKILWGSLKQAEPHVFYVILQILPDGPGNDTYCYPPLLLMTYNTFIPVNSCLLASSSKTNIIGPQKPFDKRSVAGRRRKLAQQKSTDTMMELIDTAKTSGLSADYVLFDCWFANPAQIISVKDRGMDTIAMIKKSSRIHYEYQGEQLNIKQIYSRNKKRRRRSKYLLSIDI